MARSTRGTEAPMDYEWTDRPAIKPSWSQSNDDPSGSRKRPLTDTQTTTPFGTPNERMFGANRNIPFIFSQPATPKSPETYPWMPPPNFTPTKAFPNPPELKDVDMADASPSKGSPEKEKTEERHIASGALRRVFKSRQRSKSQIRAATHEGEEHEGDDDSDVDDRGHRRLIHRPTSNHYTLNMAAAPAPKTELPNVLLGYLQFGFNLSLTLIFLYLVVQFILTVQRDVEQRISEYSMDVIQDIALCAHQYKTNLCQNNIVPAMAQQCKNWETCMNRDPAKIGRARVGAELIAEVVNGFVEPISWKALAFTLTSLAFLTVVINGVLVLFRSHAKPSHPPAPNHAPYPQIGEYHPAFPVPPMGRPRNSYVEENYEAPSRRRRLEGGNAVKIQ